MAGKQVLYGEEVLTRLLPEWWILVAMIYWEWTLFKNPSGAYRLWAYFR